MKYEMYGHQLWANNDMNMFKDLFLAYVRIDAIMKGWDTDLSFRRTLSESFDLHRIGGPAIIFPDGGEEWWVNGGLHRDDGPAVFSHYKPAEWWVDNSQVRDPDEFQLLAGITDADMLTMTLKYGKVS